MLTAVNTDLVDWLYVIEIKRVKTHFTVIYPQQGRLTPKCERLLFTSSKAARWHEMRGYSILESLQ